MLHWIEPLAEDMLRWNGPFSTSGRLTKDPSGIGPVKFAVVLTHRRRATVERPLPLQKFVLRWKACPCLPILFADGGSWRAQVVQVRCAHECPGEGD